MIHRLNIRPFEFGLLFKEQTFDRLLPPGKSWRFDPFGREKVEIVSQRSPWLNHEQLDVIVASGELDGKATVLDIGDGQRGLVWIDGRFDTVLPPGLFALWTGVRNIRTEIVDARTIRFEHPAREAILRGKRASDLLEVRDVPAEHAGLLFIDGQYAETLPAGRYAFWRNEKPVTLQTVDLRETSTEISGQEVLTADRVSLRLSALATFRVADPLKAVTATDDANQSLYREAQLAIRAAVGSRTLDQLLADKVALAAELTETLKARVKEFGLDLKSLGIRDVILPGEMKALLNKVIEARTAAEAAVITRREETAALRHQANAAKILAENPGLVRMRELEAVEKIAAAGKLNVVLGDKGLTEKVVNLL